MEFMLALFFGILCIYYVAATIKWAATAGLGYLIGICVGYTLLGILAILGIPAETRAAYAERVATWLPKREQRTVH